MLSKNIALKKYVSSLPVVYFLLLSGANFIGTAINAKLSWIDISLFGACLLVVIIKNQTLRLTFAFINLLLWGYLILAVTSDLTDYLDGAKYKDPLLYFGMGYLLSITSALCAAMMLFRREAE
jgi:hypothetical protein